MPLQPHFFFDQLIFEGSILEKSLSQKILQTMQSIKKFANYVKKINDIDEQIHQQGFIQAILMSVRRHKKFNLLIEFSNRIFIKFYFKANWH